MNRLKIQSHHRGWIGVDLDGTLAVYEGGGSYKPGVIGKPIPAMVELIKQLLDENEHDIRIMTARVWYPRKQFNETAAEREERIRRAEAAMHERHVIAQYCQELFGRTFPVTCEKDPDMVLLLDDRAQRVIQNTGQLCCDHAVEAV